MPFIHFRASREFHGALAQQGSMYFSHVFLHMGFHLEKNKVLLVQVSTVRACVYSAAAHPGFQPPPISDDVYCGGGARGRGGSGGGTARCAWTSDWIAEGQGGPERKWG